MPFTTINAHRAALVNSLHWFRYDREISDLTEYKFLNFAVLLILPLPFPDEALAVEIQSTVGMQGDGHIEKSQVV